MSTDFADSSEIAAKKPRGKPFAKGQSGNPGGRKSTDPEFKAVCEQECPAKLRAMVDDWPVLDNKTKVALIKLMASYAYGQPAQSMDLTSDGDKLQPITIVEIATKETHD